MRQTRTGLGILLLLAAFAQGPLPAAEQTSSTNAAPDLQEVYGLVRDHLTGITPAELNQTAVQALLSALSPSVSLVNSNQKQPLELSGGSPVSKSNLFEGPIAYIRIAKVEQGLPAAVRTAYEHVGTNGPKGVVLDLRFAGGDDYEAAAATADLFLKKEKPLLDFGRGLIRSTAKKEALGGPVAVLVNHGTARAAEALAAALREADVALLLGSRTAGEAMLAQEYPLQDGQRLRIATAPVKVGEGTALTHQGVKPDIAVEVAPRAELAYLADPFKEPTTTNARPAGLAASTDAAGTNRARRPRFNEAELVRERRDGISPDIELAGPGGDAEKPVVRDPVLARALDLLKGLAVIRASKS